MSQEEETVTIAAKVLNKTYLSLEDFVHDVEVACANILGPLRLNHANTSVTATSQPQNVSAEDTELLTKTSAFKKLLMKLVVREMQRRPAPLRNGASQVEEDYQEQEQTVNGPVSESPQLDQAEEDDDGKTVLTLYANAPGPKQLFSSFQQPRRVKLSTASASALDISTEVTVPLEETNLPNIISTTKVVPIHVEDAINGRKRVPKFGEIFAPPATLPQLSPPKPKHSSPRRSTISWVSDDMLASSRRSGYTYPTQSLSTGQWLGYGGLNTQQEPSSPEAKRKQRDRALSTGETNPSPSQADVEALERARVEALFRSAYSSFAPSRDDAVAVVPEGIKSQVWWHKVGKRRYQESFALDPALNDMEDPTPVPETSIATEERDEDEAFKEAVDSFSPEPVDFTKDSSVLSEAENDAEHILKEITNLIETLASYQRIRNASLPSNSRTPASHGTALAEFIGSPTSPLNAEVEVYNMLKTQLSLMISQLPPYTVAKLNGDQLAELNISKNILIETKDYRGVMEEDHVSRLARTTALSTAASTTPVPRAASASIGGHAYSASGAQYNRSTSMGQASVSRHAYAGSNTYFPQQQPPPSRSSSLNYKTPMGAAQSYHTPAGYSTAGQKSSLSQHSYNQPVSVRHQPQTSYSQANGQHYYQHRPSQQSYGYNQSHYSQGTPSHNRKYQTPNPNMTQHSSRPQNGHAMYSFNPSSSSHPRSSSPLKALIQHNQQQFAQTQMRSNYLAQNQTPRQYSQQLPVQTNNQHAPQPATPPTLGPSGFHTSMTSEQQQSLMDRQRAQFAVKPQAGFVGQAMTDGQSASTPQPTNGHVAGQVNGTPMAA